ncbi:MAG: glutamine--fructose-6-phosphate transaminase (isomerizing) [Candidatus Bathyarchaeota archaeon]
MCGIFGGILKTGNVAPLLHKSLKMLEYRGYDSAGEATIHNGKVYVKKDAGKIDEIHKALNLDELPGRIGIAHTRWATHGAPLKINAHPHLDCKEQIAVVHNGIIENFEEIKRELEAKGHIFISKTDTEVIPHLIEENIKNGLNFPKAFREAVKRLEGSYAIAAICSFEPDLLIVARKESPLIIGLSEDGYFCASDIPALLPLTRSILEVYDGEMAILSFKNLILEKIGDGSLVTRRTKTITWTLENAIKGGYPHFMLKEIHEQQESLREALRVQQKYVDLLTTFLGKAKDIFLLASGTSYHACVAGSYIFSKLAKTSTCPVIASEFIEQFGDCVNIDTTILAVSQSGETADVLRAIDHARFKAATILGLTNVIGSTLTRISRAYLCQNSGPEIGVAATKTFTAQLAVLTILALNLAKVKGKISQEDFDNIKGKLYEMPKLVGKIIDEQEENVKKIASKLKNKNLFVFLARGVNVATALEGKLKLLEVSYIPCIAYPAGESKHGPISLIEPGIPVVCICPKGETYKLMVNNIVEMKSRGATVIGVVEEDDEVLKNLDSYIEIPKGIPEVLTPIPYIVPLQLFAYYMAVEKNLDPDKPRNLAKSVTVV